MASMITLAKVNGGTFRMDQSERAGARSRDERGRFMSKREVLEQEGIEPEDTEMYLAPEEAREDIDIEEIGYDDPDDALIEMIDAQRAGELEDENEIETVEDDDPLEAMAKEEARLTARVREVAKRKPTYKALMLAESRRNAVNRERRIAEYLMLNEEDTYHLDGEVHRSPIVELQEEKEKQMICQRAEQRRILKSTRDADRLETRRNRSNRRRKTERLETFLVEPPELTEEKRLAEESWDELMAEFAYARDRERDEAARHSYDQREQAYLYEEALTKKRAQEFEDKIELYVPEEATRLRDEDRILGYTQQIWRRAAESRMAAAAP